MLALTPPRLHKETPVSLGIRAPLPELAITEQARLKPEPFALCAEQASAVYVHSDTALKIVYGSADGRKRGERPSQ